MTPFVVSRKLIGNSQGSDIKLDKMTKHKLLFSLVRKINYFLVTVNAIIDPQKRNVKLFFMQVDIFLSD